MSSETIHLPELLAEIARLAALSPAQYERERQDAAKRLKVRTAFLDKYVADQRGAVVDRATGRPVVLRDVEPWPEPVDLAGVLADLRAAVRRHVVMPDEAATAVALWAAHTWVYERFQHTPRLGITSPTKRCGKSTLLAVLRLVCRRTIKADGISASGTFRTVEALKPVSLLLDEADAYLRENEALRGVLNSGFERDGSYIRIQEVNGVFEPRQFETFAPAAIAAIGKLPSTLEDRSLPIRLSRKTATDLVEKLRARGNRGGLADLARKLCRWAADEADALSDDPGVPEAMSDREGDISVSLLAIADQAGGAWPERARVDLLRLFGIRGEDTEAEAGVLLLADLRELFLGTSAVRMASADICQHLAGMEDRPWPEWRQGKAITPRQLAVVLAPFGIRPANLRGMDGRVPKGYYREAFAEAWDRYLPSFVPQTS
jgi:Protein of unknown function (DUF3631)